MFGKYRQGFTYPEGNDMIHPRTRVKICSITNLNDALMAVEYGADALGFIFCESKRIIAPEMARNIIRHVPPLINTVGVFMDNSIEEVRDISSFTGVDIIQLHGSEDPAYCQEFKKRIIKRIHVSADDNPESLHEKMEIYELILERDLLCFIEFWYLCQSFFTRYIPHLFFTSFV